MVTGHSPVEGSVAHVHSTSNGLFLLTLSLKKCPKYCIGKPIIEEKQNGKVHCAADFQD
jgi:hypothetical protein